MTCEDTHNATSLPVSADGPTRCSTPAGQQADLFGPDHARVSRSVQQAKAKGQPTSDTCGQSFTGLSLSARLQQSLASRLVEKQGLLGSMLYKMTWKQVATPAGRLHFRLAVSAPRTCDSDCTGWATPASSEPGGTAQQALQRKQRARENGVSIGLSVTHLSHQAQLVGWPTITATDAVKINASYRPGAAGISELIGSDAPMAKRGQLNPALARWLMGYPIEHDVYADTETP